MNIYLLVLELLRFSGAFFVDIVLNLMTCEFCEQ